jgi:DNA invertase Pin-like site-specific DNA recombinase
MPDYLPPPTALKAGSTVWAYLRDSGGPSQGESIERQRDEISNYCTRHSLQLVHVFVDEARSGGSADGRDDFSRMISLSAHPDPCSPH